MYLLNGLSIMLKRKIVYFFFVMLFSVIGNAQAHVKGYYRKDGTYVRPHARSNPDGNPYNNWSYPGNVNPYTGKVATGNPKTYLKSCQNIGNYTFRSTIPLERLSDVRGQVSVNVLNVRLSPSVNSSIVGKLNYSDVVGVHGLYGDWAFVKYQYIDSKLKVNTLEGYVSTKYLITRLVYD